MRCLCLYVVCAWLSSLPTARAGIIVNWLYEPIVLSSFLPEYYEIDLNDDGFADFTFVADLSFLGSRSEGNNQYVIYPSPPPNIGGPIVPLNEGFEIGLELAGSLAWFGTNTDFGTLGLYLTPPSSDPFKGQNAFMGVQFYVDDAVHYGWINLWIHEDGPIGRIYGWAYESNPDTPIIAGAIPEPNTLLLLLAGGIGLLFLKSRSRNTR